jgi:hypothetical protein
MESTRAKRERDFEIRYEMDLLKCTDMDLVKQRIREDARRLLEGDEDAMPLSRQKAQGKNNYGMEELETVMDVEDTLRCRKAFDYGMMIPDTRSIHPSTGMLDAKKQLYSSLHQKNEELKRIEQEMMEIDPSRVASIKLQEEQMSIQTVFGEHEIMSYMLLRNLRSRDLRAQLLSQHNFYRSIEKRITYDVRG